MKTIYTLLLFVFLSLSAFTQAESQNNNPDPTKAEQPSLPIKKKNTKEKTKESINSNILGKNQNEILVGIFTFLITSLISLLLYTYKKSESGLEKRIEDIENKNHWDNNTIVDKIQIANESLKTYFNDKGLDNAVSVLETSVSNNANQILSLQNHIEKERIKEYISIDNSAYNEERFEVYIEEYFKSWDIELRPLIPATTNLAKAYVELDEKAKAKIVKSFLELIMKDKFEIFQLSLAEIDE